LLYPSDLHSFYRLSRPAPKKLVRDNSVEHMKSHGACVSSRVLSERELPYHLIEKLKEEAQELGQARTSSDQAEEMADICEILEAYLALIGLSEEEVRKARIKKKDNRGGFTHGNFVEYIEVPEGSQYDVYCGKTPEKYQVREIEEA
ncbi:MAG TPA: nucleoside triphosphate pyrophosphohydrolase, partial [Alphaproteobacteria bacterium]|nr:nucleoside triphosphate pyrophosphohydrolase [Alphaproteobacteria bacterium]